MKDVRIAVDRQHIGGKLILPEPPVNPKAAVVFVHGWGSTQRRDIAKAKRLALLDCACLTFNLRGHARTRRQVETVTRAQNLRDLIAAYDFLVEATGVNPERIGVVGSSYGGYLATLLTGERKVQWLALRAPALYKDVDFDRPKRQLNLDADLPAYRRRSLDSNENRVLTSASRFEGDVLIVESQTDTIIPAQVIDNYGRAFTAARSVSHRVLAQADHALSRESWRQAYGRILLSWFEERLRSASASSAIALGVRQTATSSRESGWIPAQ
jgi:pimeloyl-ACP methyl ester carboxylesterase